MGKTLFITDLDGTLLNKDAKISPVTAKIINKLIDNGLIFTYATARGFESATKVAHGINFKYPAVYNNGVFVQNSRTGDFIEKRILAQEKIGRIIEICETNNFYPAVFAFIDGRSRVSWIKGNENDGLKSYLADRKGDKRKRPVENHGELRDGDIYDITFHGGSYEELEKILRVLDLNSHFAHFIAKDTYKDLRGNAIYYSGITRFDATKDIGVLKVKELVGADKIVCFGDNMNDISMFNISDEKYAVANAVDEIKNLATAVIGSNDDDGVAKWLEENNYER